jgi:subtilase family serine protease
MTSSFAVETSQSIAHLGRRSFMRNRRRAPRQRPDLDELDDRCLLSGYSSYEPTGYTPAQITAAYGLNAISFTSSSGATVKGDGTGETIALIEMYDDPNIQSDLATFDAKYNLPAPTLTVVNQAGGQTDSGWALEESMDVEWAHATAPGASILVVEAAPSYSQTQELQNLLSAVNQARSTAGVVAVSMSWGFNEMQNESSFDAYFTTPTGHQGVTFIAASGDNGIVDYPSASPNVLSVGGTTLNLASAGAYSSESAWVSGGGGYSAVEKEPSYQGTVQTSGARSTPDVAFDADPNTGVLVYSTAPGATSGSWQVVGGTSLGAPSWAGIIAIVDQGRALAGKGSLDGPTQTLPALYAAPSSNFNSVPAPTSSSFAGFSFGGFDPFAGFAGFSGYSSSFWGGFGWGLGLGTIGTTSSGATANTYTGLGSPKGASLISDLVASTLTTPLSTISGSGSSGSGSAPVSPPTQPTKPVGRGSKHHSKHPAAKKTAHASKATGHKLVNQAHKSAKHVI